MGTDCGRTAYTADAVLAVAVAALPVRGWRSRWPMLFVGEKEPKAMQRFLNLAFWDADALRDLVCDYAIEHLNDPRGILVADPTGFAKKGRKSAGVQR